MTGRPPTEPARRVLALLVKIAVSLGLLVLLVGRSDAPRLWTYVRSASIAWLVSALGLYLLMVLASAWRWGVLLRAQGVRVRGSSLTASFLVATFFNNFLPSNIGGDVVRVSDTARALGSKTLATTVVLMDRGLGLLGLVLLAAAASSLASPPSAGTLAGPIALWLVFAAASTASVVLVAAPGVLPRLLAPLTWLHAEWVGERIRRLTDGLHRFRGAPGALAWCFGGALVVQGLLVAFYVAVARAIGVEIAAVHMAVIVPMSFIVQLLPVSLNGLGVREATFSFYFSRLGLPIEAALVVSLLGAGLIMLFSLSGAVVYVARGR